MPLPFANRTALPAVGPDLRALLRLAGPILVVQLAQMGIATTDVLISGRAGATALAGVAVGASSWIPLFLCTLGILYALTPTVAQQVGGGRSSRTGAATRAAAILGLVLSGAIVVLLTHAHRLFSAMGIDPEVQPVAAEYLHLLAQGVPGMVGFQILRNFHEGHGRTRPVLAISVLAFLLNIPLDLLFVFGWGPIPGLGGPGCGLATAVIWWSNFALMLAISCADRATRRSWGVRWRVWPRTELRELVRIGMPMGAAMAFESGLFSAVSLFIATLGATAVAAHQVAFNITAFLFMVPLSLSLALTVRTGQLLGARQAQRARALVRSALALAGALVAVNAALLLGTRHELVTWYTGDLAVQHTAARLLVFAALFQAGDVFQVVLTGALRAHKDTRVPMWLAMLSCWGIALPLGYLLGMTPLLGGPFGAQGFWMGLIVALSLMALSFALRLRHVSTRQPVAAEPPKQGGELGAAPLRAVHSSGE